MSFVVMGQFFLVFNTQFIWFFRNFLQNTTKKTKCNALNVLFLFNAFNWEKTLKIVLSYCLWSSVNFNIRESFSMQMWLFVLKNTFEFRDVGNFRHKGVFFSIEISDWNEFFSSYRAFSRYGTFDLRNFYCNWKLN